MSFLSFRNSGEFFFKKRTLFQSVIFCVLAFLFSSLARFSKQTVQWLQMLEAFNKALKVNFISPVFFFFSQVILIRDDS